ncbi:MAG: hypothetical protein ACD_58C00328G0002 [uncultured bacterium]|nr:MAG: hypothetical protein ACD_58C00328G0002 [uncultured bacterium]
MHNQTDIKSRPNSLSLFTNWYFIEIPKFFVLVYTGLQKKIWYYFNITFLLKTIFQPWKRDLVVPVNPSIIYYIQAFIENLISRFMGLVIRFVAIITGLVLIILVNVLFAVLMIIWYCLLFLLILSFIKGILGLINS